MPSPSRSSGGVTGLELEAARVVLSVPRGGSPRPRRAPRSAMSARGPEGRRQARGRRGRRSLRPSPLRLGAMRRRRRLLGRRRGARREALRRPRGRLTATTRLLRPGPGRIGALRKDEQTPDAQYRQGQASPASPRMAQGRTGCLGEASRIRPARGEGVHRPDPQALARRHRPGRRAGRQGHRGAARGRPRRLARALGRRVGPPGKSPARRRRPRSESKRLAEFRVRIPFEPYSKSSESRPLRLDSALTAGPFARRVPNECPTPRSVNAPDAGVWQPVPRRSVECHALPRAKAAGPTEASNPESTQRSRTRSLRVARRGSAGLTRVTQRAETYRHKQVKEVD